MTPSEPSGWREASALVLSQLERCVDRLDDLEEKLQRIEVDLGIQVATLRTRVALWGAGGGGFTAMVALVLKELLER